MSIFKSDVINQAEFELIGWQVCYTDETNVFVEYSNSGIQPKLFTKNVIRICQVGKKWDKRPINVIARESMKSAFSTKKIIKH